MGDSVHWENDICLNCAEKVPERFCTNCGQENVPPRKTFMHLVTHFVHDFTHYDNAFWKTIRYLLFKPARLTREYLSGRRKAYVPPIKLYIFINFLTFFLLAILPIEPDGSSKVKVGTTGNTEHYRPNNDEENIQIGEYRTVREYDSVFNSTPQDKRRPKFLQKIERRLAEVNESTPPGEFQSRVWDGVIRNLPKVLFIYMPLFAFILWIFHGKKRWYYYDHAIFTLHYFSFILLTFSIEHLLLKCFENFENLNILENITGFSMMFWWFFYFFSAHRRLYNESWLVSAFKGLFMFVINIIIILFLTVAVIVYTALSINS